MTDLLTMSALYSPELRRLCIRHLSSLAQLGPTLASFTNLTNLDVTTLAFNQSSIVGWPKPTFRLETLRSGHCFSSDPAPGLVELDWLIASSRPSLRHLHLEGYDPDIIDDILQWGHNLHTIQIGFSSWSDDAVVANTLKLVRLQAVRQLTLSVVRTDEGEAEFDPNQYEASIEKLNGAADGCNNELGREVVLVDLRPAGDMWRPPFFP